eukprot:5377602-Pyramimonas_sp.AAC.1
MRPFCRQQRSSAPVHSSCQEYVPLYDHGTGSSSSTVELPSLDKGKLSQSQGVSQRGPANDDASPAPMRMPERNKRLSRCDVRVCRTSQAPPQHHIWSHRSASSTSHLVT